jgi:flavin reductase (DIM6/NTAB) family NADH-FMN oxidoreductase RutF
MCSIQPLPIQPLTADIEVTCIRQALSSFATCLSIAPTFVHGAQNGDTASSSILSFTASSFNSISLTPPLVPLGLSHRANSLPLLIVGFHNLANVLADNQMNLWQRLASGHGDRLARTNFCLGQTTSPFILKSLLTWFKFHNRIRYEGCGHVISFHEVERSSFANGRQDWAVQNSLFSTTKGQL